MYVCDGRFYMYQMLPDNISAHLLDLSTLSLSIQLQFFQWQETNFEIFPFRDSPILKKKYWHWPTNRVLSWP